ncbi:MAG: tetratricopeptide repeat protein, partial [Ktedonobacteraceae bacterium]|nr:tetratricopeptide repeat protein [Ktedonobacteraceae bacterium]
TTQPLPFLPFSPTTTATRANRTAFLLLTGEPGIGKTRLAEELSLEAYARGWAVAWSRIYEQEGNIPYHLWTDLLRTLLQNTSTLKDLLTSSSTLETSPESPVFPFKVERLGVILPEFTAHSGTVALSAGTAVPVLHEQERLHLWEATLGLLSMLSQIYPLLFVLDDLHWADDSSIELLTYLTHHFQNQRILFVGTCRDGELSRPHKLRTLITDLQREQTIVTLPVQPLSQSEIGTLVSHLPIESVESIQQQAAGNPFFAEELARHESGMIFPGEHQPAQQLPDNHNRQTSHSKQAAKTETGIPHPTSPLPEPVAAVLERRLSRLSAGCQALLSRAAVLGGSFELNQLLSMAAASDEETVFDLLEEAMQAGLLSEEDGNPRIIYHFLHPLIINHLYSRLSAARRMQLHRRAAEAIKAASPSSQQEQAAAIVYHLSRGGGDPQDIAFYAELAGNRAYSIAAYSEARRYYLQAIQALLGQPLYKPEHADAQNIIRNLDTRSLSQISASNPLSLCRILEHIAECCKILGNFEEARLLYACLLDLRSSRSFQQYLAQTGDSRETSRRREAQVQALLWREIGHTWTSIGEYTRAYECYEHGRRVMEQAGVSSGTAWACLHMAYGDMLRLEGRYLEARRYLEEALAELEIELHAGQPEPTSLLHKELQTRTERALLGDPLEVGYGYERLGIAVASSGQLSNALQYMHTALKIYEQSELVSDMARICGNLGVVHVLRGEQNEARAFMRRSLGLAERTGDLPNQSFVMGNLGEVAHRSGDLLEAESWLKQSLLIAEHINDRERLSIYSADLAVTQQDLGKMQEAKASVLRAIRLGHAVRNPRIIRYALVRLGDLRITEAVLACQFQLPDIFDSPSTSSPALPDLRLLRRAQHILQRAITLEGREIDNAIEGKHLLATVYYLRGEFEVAQALAQQTLKAAQEQEAIRSIGRIYRLLGRIFAARQNHVQAMYHLEQARQLFLERALWLDYARTLHSLGITLLRRYLAWCDNQQRTPQTEPLQSDDQLYQQGLAYLQEAYAIFTRSHAALDLAWINQTLARVEAYSAQKHLRSLPI